MYKPAPRLHRLPQRLDYTLMPAPLDLSLPLATEKSALPAIIVTPSSPSSARDFSIAFLAPTPKPSARQRITSWFHWNVPHLSGISWRAFVITFILIFVLVCHFVTHRLAVQRPHLEFSVQTGEAYLVDSKVNWFDFRSLFSLESSSHDISVSSSAVTS